jgi:uncharacterized protein DUF6968
MEDLIAERILTLEVDGEPPKSIRMRVGKPEKVGDGDWKAAFEIHGPGPEDFQRREMFGVDAWQALTLVMWFAPIAIETRVGSRGRLAHLGDPDWRGAPPPTPPL